MTRLGNRTHPVPYWPEQRWDEANSAFSTMPLLGHEAGIERDAEVLRKGRPAHLEMSRKRIDGAVGLDEEVWHPAMCGSEGDSSRSR